MKILKLKRMCMTDHGTFGVMIDQDVTPYPFCVTLELPWKDNKPEVSCIPKGEYRIQRVQSPKFGNVFQVMNVPNRFHILIHKGNFTTDALGCILLGEYFNQGLNPKADKVFTSVQSSGAAYNEFNKIMFGQEEGTLVIEEA